MKTWEMENTKCAKLRWSHTAAAAGRAEEDGALEMHPQLYHSSTSTSFAVGQEHSTACPRILDPSYTVSYYIHKMGQDFLDIQQLCPIQSNVRIANVIIMIFFVPQLYERPPKHKKSREFYKKKYTKFYEKLVVHSLISVTLSSANSVGCFDSDELKCKYRLKLTFY